MQKTNMKMSRKENQNVFKGVLNKILMDSI
jgi:hypothetical protein